MAAPRPNGNDFDDSMQSAPSSTCPFAHSIDVPDEAPATKRQRLHENAFEPPQPPNCQPHQPPPPPPPATPPPASPPNTTLHDIIDHVENMEMHERLRDFDVLDEVQGDDEDDDDDDDDDCERNEMAGGATDQHRLEDDDSSDTDLETDSGLVAARRLEVAKAKQSRMIAAKCSAANTNAINAAATGAAESADASHVTVAVNGNSGGGVDIDLNEDELDALLNEGLPEHIRNKKFESQYDEKFKTVLVELEQNHFEVLPEGWVQVNVRSLRSQ